MGLGVGFRYKTDPDLTVVGKGSDGIATSLRDLRFKLFRPLLLKGHPEGLKEKAG